MRAHRILFVTFFSIETAFELQHSNAYSTFVRSVSRYFHEMLAQLLHQTWNKLRIEVRKSIPEHIYRTDSFCSRPRFLTICRARNFRIMCDTADL